MTAIGLTVGQAEKIANGVMFDFQNEMKDSFGDLYYMSMDEAIRVASQRDPQFMYLLGKATWEWQNKGMTARRQREAMERVASMQEDKIKNFPAAPNELVPELQIFLTGMQEEMTDFDWSFFPDKGVQAAKSIVETKDEVISFVGNVGTGIGEVASNIGQTVKNATGAIAGVSKYYGVFIAAAMIGVLMIGYQLLKRKADEL